MDKYSKAILEIGSSLIRLCCGIEEEINPLFQRRIKHIPQFHSPVLPYRRLR